MKINVMLIALGLHSAVVGADCAALYDTSDICREGEASSARLRQFTEQQNAEYEAQRQRTRPVQVVEPGGVRTFYPGTDGTWTTYDPPLRSRR